MIEGFLINRQAGQGGGMNVLVSTAATTWEQDCLGWLVQPSRPGCAFDGHGQIGQGCVPVPLWEWTVTRDALGASAGICGTYRGAIKALAAALIEAGRPRRGQVVPVLLTDPGHKPPYYLRGNPENTAVFDGKAVQWT